MRGTRTTGTALIGKNIHRVSTKVRDTPGGLRPLGVTGWNLAGEAFQTQNYRTFRRASQRLEVAGRWLERPTTSGPERVENNRFVL